MFAVNWDFSGLISSSSVSPPGWNPSESEAGGAEASESSDGARDGPREEE